MIHRFPGHISLRQFDSVSMLPVALVIVGKHFFQPLRLSLRILGIRQRGMMTNHELLATSVTSHGSHRDEVFYSVLAFPDCYRVHHVYYRHIAEVHESEDDRVDQLFIFGRFHARIGCEEALGEAVREVVSPSRQEEGVPEHSRLSLDP